MKKILAKLLLISLPLIITGLLYIYTDPFKVIYHYDNFYDNSITNAYLNRDYISTELLLNNHDKYHYDSYIFGSSRSGVFKATEWAKHINASGIYHYNAYNEQIYGIERKVDFLHKKGYKIKNALVVLDYELLNKTNNQDGVYRMHFLTSGESNLSFQLSMFKVFLDPRLITMYPALIREHIMRKQRPEAHSDFFDIRTNEESLFRLVDSAITYHRDSFYHAAARIFYKRPSYQMLAPHVIMARQIKMLLHIKSIFDADGTDYRIVLSPIYNQKKTHPLDIQILQKIFGKDRVYDFSGINEFTQDVSNYYEETHFRSGTATRLMDSIYKK